MRTLILGGGGLLGREVTAVWRQRGATALAPTRAEGDLLDPDRLRRQVEEFRPQWIVNCAAFTRVDDCETRRDEAFAVNGEAVAQLAALAATAGARLLQVSTDYVFDGSLRRPLREGDPPAPASVYGASKLAGERVALACVDARSLVVRISWLFGAGGPSFPRAILRQLDERRRHRSEEPLRVVADQTGCPTYAPFVARALWDLAAAGASGIVHYRNREPVSWHGFALAIVAAAGATLAVDAVETADVPRPAPRPAYSVLDVELFERLTGRRVEPWADGLREFIAMARAQAEAAVATPPNQETMR